MITIKRLNTNALIEEACSLLYQVYILQKKWQFCAENPSELRIEVRNNKRVLVDRFTDRGIWFGAFDDEKLVGCVRLFSVDENGQLEIETYSSSHPIQSLLPLQEKDRCYDISKMATKENYVGRGIVKRLLLACFRFCQENQYHALAFTHNGYLKSLLKKIEFPMKMEQAFKYEPQDTSAVNFYFADYNKSEVNEVLKKLEYLESDLSNNARSIFKALQIVETILPTPFYWMNAQGVVLGINGLGLKAMGTTREIIGKQPYAFYKQEIAEHILAHNSEVIEKEEILAQEEWIEDITTKERKCFSSVKAPLYDDEGTIIGIIGTSIEITAQKEAERLELENQIQRTSIEYQNKIVSLARKVAHDINSPLLTLRIMLRVCEEVPEHTRSMMNRAVESILDIANNLLTTYQKEDQQAITDIEQRQPLLISDLLIQLLSEKKIQYSSHSLGFESYIADDAQFAFAQMQPSQFRRTMSNLINNAVDATDNKNGIVTIKFNADRESISVTVQDNGKGMPPALVEKIMNRQSFSEDKENGHGIGLQQVWDTIDNNEGKIAVISTPGEGTSIQLNFPRVEAAIWLAEEINLTTNSIIVVLDDDESIHGAWDARFNPYIEMRSGLGVKHFTQGQDTLKFFDELSSEDKNRIVFLCDFELLKQRKNGLQIIEASGIKNTVLVTSYYANPEIQNKAAELGISILPKQMASIIPIKVCV